MPMNIERICATCGKTHKSLDQQPDYGTPGTWVWQQVGGSKKWTLFCGWKCAVEGGGQAIG